MFYTAAVCLSHQLSTSKGMFLMQRTNTLYVADFGNKHVQMFSLDKSSGSTINVASNVNSPWEIYVDDGKDAPSSYISVFIGN